MSAQMNAVRRQDETSPQDEAHDRSLGNAAFLDASTVSASEGLEAAIYSGELAEAYDEFVDDDAERLDEAQRHAGHRQRKEADKLRRGRPAGGAETDGERDASHRTEDRLGLLRWDAPDESGLPPFP